LGRALGMPGIEQACDADVARLKKRFRAFAPAAELSAPAGEPIDRSVAQAALEALQLRHNAERAALAAMREQAAPKAVPPGRGRGKSRFVEFWRSRFGRGRA
jgi:hypothetical protein